MYTNEWAAYFSYITMDGIVGGYSVWLNPFHCCRYLMHSYHGKLQGAGKLRSPHVIIIYYIGAVLWIYLVCYTIVKFIIT